MRYLLVEDAEVATAITDYFLGKGHAIDHADTIAAAKDHLSVQSYDALVLDLNLPDGNGMNLLRDLRKAAQSTPVLILSVNHSIETRLKGFDEGADDYLFKPFDMRELDARLRALVRQGTDEKRRSVTLGEVDFDFIDRAIRHRDKPIPLPPKDFALLEVLIHNLNRPVSKSVLQDKLYPFEQQEVSPNAVELRVARLRKKLEPTGIGIKALWGIGYQLDWGD